MAKPKVLILDGQSAAATECLLALTPGCEIHLSTPGGRCGFSLQGLTRVLTQPEPPAALRTWTEDLFRREDYQLVIPTTEVSLHALKARDLSPELRVRMAIPEEDAIDLALNKLRTLELAAELGIPIPASSLMTSLNDLPQSIRYPVVIKPLYSKLPVQGRMRSFGAHICADRRSALDACAKMLPHAPVIRQEYFRGRGAGVEVLFEHGKLRWWFAHERVHALPVTGGASTYRRSIEAPEPLLRAANALLSRLRWHGVAMVEFKVSPEGEYRLMEINPRLWGSLPLAVAAGVDFPAGLLRLARGEPPGEQPRYRRGLYMRHLALDLVWYAQSWKERDNPLRIKPLQAADWWGLLRIFIGSERWDFFRWRAPGVWWTCMRSSLGSLYRDQRSGTVRKATDENWSKLQEGWRADRIRRVLVLCYGNVCRSPVAARLLSDAGLEVKSAGFLPSAERVPPEDWVRVVENTLALDLRDHRPSTVTKDMIQWADMILLMDTANWQALSRTFPAAMNKAVLLGATTRGAAVDTPEIRDPYQLEDHLMQAIALTIKCHVQELLDQRGAATAVRDTAPQFN
ncbi:MAG TPA: ATP-grasp domain-containing protein [Rhodanobacteraceae bacterium]|nr:ATP-grasp domain-containing protein [Rhodanobacteraceae bacterium]